MKKTALVFACIIFMVLNMCSCGTNIECDFEYDINEYKYFSDFMDNKTEDEWLEQGNFTILINGLETPVVLEMQGMQVVTATAFDRTERVDIDTFEGYTAANIRGADGAVIITEELDYSSRSWIMTKDKTHTFKPEDSISTTIRVKDDGTIAYTRYWGEYMTSFNQWDTAPLDLCKSRDEFLYQRGTVRIDDGKVFLNPEETVTVSDEYDLDTMFEEAKNNGMYQEFENVDELLSSNAKP